MQCFSTVTIPPRQKVAFWNHVAGDALAEMQIRPRSASAFEGTLYRDDLGPLGIGRASSTPARIERTREQIARAPDRLFLINFCAHGRFSIAQGGREALLEEGDFTVTDTGQPFVMLHHSPCDAVVVRIPERLMRAHIPLPEDLIGRAVSGRKGLNAVAASMLRALGQELGPQAGRPLSGGLCSERGAGVAIAVMEIIAAACSSVAGVAVGETASVAARRIRMRRFIEAGLRNPEMSPGAVAVAFGISERYVRAIFSTEGEAISAYILRRRLEECARRLRDPLWRSRSVSEIAYEWGFNSLGSFGRAFKSRYGVTPREFRDTPG